MERKSAIAIASINPATGETLRSFEPLADSQIEGKLARAAATYRTWRSTAFGDRRRMMLAAAEILEKEKAEWGRIMTAEMGKPIKAARDEAAKCALAAATTPRTPRASWRRAHRPRGRNEAYIRYQPIGPCWP